MERVTKQRAPVRGMITRITREVEVELNKDPPPDNLVDTLSEKLDKLLDTEVRLNHLDERVLEAMLEGDAAQDLYDAQFNEIEEHKDRLRSIKKRILAKLPQAGYDVPLGAEAASSHQTKRTFKLPKIEIKKFNGDLKEFMGWWAQFEKIHDDEELHTTDKFQYLVQATVEGSRARRLVEGYPQTAANYPKVIEAIKDRFGDKVLLTELYVRQLARLVIANASKSRPQSLSFMYDELESSLRALESLGVTADKSAAFLYPLVESSLPEELLKVWQRSRLAGYDDDDGEETPVDKRLTSLMKFLRKEVKGAERLSFVSAGLENSPKERKRLPQDLRGRGDDPPTAACLIATESSRCAFCEKSHETKDCSKGSTLTMKEKKTKLDKRRSCYSCLRSGHNAKVCKAFIKCALCDKKHHTIMCPELSSIREGRSSPKRSGTVETTADMAAMTCTATVILKTLRVKLFGPNGTRVVRALIDDGSQKSYILSSTVTKLGLPTLTYHQLAHAVFGGSCSDVETHSLHRVDAASISTGDKLKISLLTKNKICCTLAEVQRWRWVKSLEKRGVHLSDVGHGPQEIEILIGANLCPFILTGRSARVNEFLLAVETRLGWTVFGQNPEADDDCSIASMIVASCTAVADIEKLWRLDSIGITDPITRSTEEEEETMAKQKFLQSIHRQEDGRYVIALPWNNGEQPIPSNKGVAFKRLESATRKLKANNKYLEYERIFDDWLCEGLIELGELVEEDCHYLPHRPVYKPESLTTPVRPVFDASCKTGRHPSLNDCLHKGPNELQLIPSLLHRFRRGKIGVVADIRKAYQMIGVRPEDRKYLQFLWWDKQGQLLAYRHTRVVFGVNCSAFLLAATLEHHLGQCNEQEKSIALKISSGMYVDNLVSSVSSQKELSEFIGTATEVLARARMDLRQWEWTSGDSTGVGLLPDSERGLGLGSRGSHQRRSQESIVLGVQWNKFEDTLSCSVPVINLTEEQVLTKRIVLSLEAQVFDPVGWCAPALLVPKLILQDSWNSKIGWDIQLPEGLSKRFKEWASEIEYLKLIRVPRFVFEENLSNQRIQLHTFSDASKCAYAACVFLRVEDYESGQVTVHLMESKAKVAPLNKPTIPRLELLGCLIGVRLATGIIKALDLQQTEHFYWTDSTVALAWIRRNDAWGTFVGNRVKEIVKFSQPIQWRYVPGELNPADLPSRGCHPKELAQSRWWEGPDWLKKGIETWPNSNPKADEAMVGAERRKTITANLLSSSTVIPWYVRKYSDFDKNIRVLCIVLRFLKKCQKKKICNGPMTVAELEEAEKKMFLLVQMECFPKNAEVIEGLRVSKGEDGLYRVNTKLLHREDTTAFRKPILLPSTHPLTAQLIRYTHSFNSHCGVQSLMCHLREKVWIIRGRKSVKAVLSRCVLCRRFSSKAATVPTASLPEVRVGNNRAFDVTGVDLAGPIQLKDKSKIWIVLYTCALYRCVHLEIVDSLSTEAFMLCLQRFICRRGRPSVMCSDNGTNFVGTNNLFGSLDWEKIESYSSTRRIQWRFNPPSAAWWGGWWERLIRTVKDLLKRMLGKSKLNLTHFSSLLCEVESEVNRRPLTYVSEDVDDLIPLTPEMFIMDLPHSRFPEATEPTGDQLRGALKSLQQLRNELRIRFRKEYLATLVHRGKDKKTEALIVGDIVLVGCDQKKRILWPMGRILELLPGVDGKCRVAKVRVKEGIITRPLQRLFPLEVPSPHQLPTLEPEVLESAKQAKGVQEEIITTRSGRRVKKPERLGTIV